VGIGTYPDFGSAAGQMVTISGRYESDQQLHRDYQFYLQSYQATYPQLKELMQGMSRRQADLVGA